jgi:ribonuclease P/MRP protein subunit POP1
MKEDNTPTVTARRRTPSRRLRLRLETAKASHILNKKSKTIRQSRKEGKTNAKKPDPADHVAISRIPRIKKNKLLEPPKATSKFKRRQVNKTWLPTHLWHAKRARMTKPTEPLWRMAIPLSPTEKSYRPTHRASGSRGCIAWDMSYISTIGCQGPEASLEGLLKSIGFAGEDWKGAKYRRWKSGSRSGEGWTFQRDNGKDAIAPVIVVWCAENTTSVEGALANGTDQGYSETAANRKLFIRVHPSAFYQVWTEVIKVAKMQRPQVLLEDLRFEIGSVEVSGPGSTEALLSVLKPTAEANGDATLEGVWNRLAGLTNPASLPANATMCFDIPDPRLRHPPSQVVLLKDEAALNALNDLIVSWPPDKAPAPSSLFSQKRRHLAATSMLSQKAIFRRKAEGAADQTMKPKANDARIPIILVASRPRQGVSNAQGLWTLMIPWKCLDSVWRSLMYYSLTSGGTPRFGGLDQKRQTLFEHGQPWFPTDMPGTEAGQAWERTQCENRFEQWLQRPPSRRIAWETVDLGDGKKGEHGNGWTCDWEFLFLSGTKPAPDDPNMGSDPSNFESLTDRKSSSQKIFTQRQRKAARAEAEQVAARIDPRRRNTSSPESEDDDSSPIESDLMGSMKMLHMPFPAVAPILGGRSGTHCPVTPALTTVRVSFLARGTPNAAARIYRLPSSSAEASSGLRKLWLNLDEIGGQEQRTEARAEKSKFKKDKLNRHGAAKVPSALPKDSLRHVQYLPPDAHADVVAQYGPQDEATSSWPSTEEREEQLRQLMFPNMTHEERIKHPACPDANDLIGFVTTGSYNLAEGKGVAIASVWVQRVVEGWKQDNVGSNAYSKKQKDRERHLCIVRNAGEGVGRLASWELC